MEGMDVCDVFYDVVNLTVTLWPHANGRDAHVAVREMNPLPFSQTGGQEALGEGKGRRSGEHPPFCAAFCGGGVRDERRGVVWRRKRRRT